MKVNSKKFRRFIEDSTPAISIIDIAKKLHLEPNSVSRKISNERRFNLDELVILSKMFGISLSRFIKFFFEDE